MEKVLEKLDSLLQHVTGKRVFLVLVLFLGLLMMYTAFENRQVLYKESGLGNFEGDYELQKPSIESEKIIKDFMSKYPNIAMISLIDADPINNRRKPVARYFNSPEIESIFAEVLRKNPDAGDGPLVTASPESNSQVYAIMNGEFQCAPNQNTILTNQFPGSDKLVAYSCRIPLPPAFNKATGWFTIQLKSWPDAKIEEMKVDALNMSLQYYNHEIKKEGPVKSQGPSQ